MIWCQSIIATLTAKHSIFRILLHENVIHFVAHDIAWITMKYAPAGSVLRKDFMAYNVILTNKFFKHFLGYHNNVTRVKHYLIGMSGLLTLQYRQSAHCLGSYSDETSRVIRAFMYRKPMSVSRFHKT